VLHGLQRQVGNLAVTTLIERSSAGAPCHCGGKCSACASHEHEEGEEGEQASSPVQRDTAVVEPPATTPKTAAPPGSPAAPGPVDPNACPDPAEQTRKETFAKRTDMKLTNHIPSVGLGKFDIAYQPKTGKLPVTVKLHFQFTDDASAPTGMARLLRRLRGDDLSSVIWDKKQKDDYVSQFTTRVHDRWSGAHTIKSIKPCWNFVAVPDVNVSVVDDKAKAHFAVTVHKSPGPDIDYKSAVNNEHLADPTKQPTADFYQSDNREEPDFNSAAVAKTERERIEAAITAAAAGRVLFEVNTATMKPGGADALKKVAEAFKAANPSAPLIPIVIEGFASSEGKVPRNTELAQQRADAAAKVLTDAGIRQPVSATGKGPVGAARDANNRAATLAANRTFETTYKTNRYSVSEHEFGHMLGMPDEYSNATTGLLGGAQSKYVGLVTSAGLAVPTFGEDTSSQMSNGVDVLPRHYVTFWEALAKMTVPDLTQADWSLK
jgi:outer membrane protein OmpA-like peptidoglycan-associated protein